jgi:asparagine synthase (glutamine-hydrolysing)
MCGIAGYITLAPSPEAEQAVKTMLPSLARRGPDSSGLANWPGAALGHRRLAILDLSPAGHQPMLSEDGQIGLVFNGCIYNFLELREELEDLGHRFHSRCDTEVLLRGYREWGIDALVPRLRGMFAFAIWDHPRGVLTLVRDRLGVKPLAYCVRGGRIAFASTVAAVRAAGFGGEIDPLAMLEFLEYGYVTDARSIYRDIAKLPPATILEWRAGQLSQRQYWTLPETGESSRMTFEEAVEETEKLLVESVGLRLVSDVPIGVLLSGGIDSALVCWAMRQWNANIKAFTVRAPDDPSDESAGAARTARTLGISHEIVDMPEAHFSLDHLVDAYSEPFACPSAQAMLWVSEAVKRRATVLLTGDGGDDVFLGYPFFRNAWLAERLARRLPDAAPAAWGAVRGRFPASGPARRLRSYLDYATGGLGAHARAWDGLPYYEHRAMLGERLAGRELAQRQIPASLESARSLLSGVFHFHRRMHFLSEFMPKVDGGTMYYAIEARAPFLDHKIWEFAAALPPEIRFHGRRLKAVLREIVRRRVGPEVAFRKKQGFTVPVESWLADRWSGLLGRLREGTLLEADGWIRPGSLEAPLRDAAGKRWVPAQLWRLLVLEHWLEKAGES